MLARALNGNPHLQQYRILFITGIRSGVLSRLDRSSMELIVRRTFTSVQLRTILVENHHPFLIVEHNPLLYEKARDMAGHVSQAMKQASREASSCTPRHWTGTWKPWPNSPTGSSAPMICSGRPTAKAEASRRRWQARPPGSAPVITQLVL